MKEVIILILLLCITNTVLLIIHMNKKSMEGFNVDRTCTRVGPYEGITSCSSWGVRNVYDSNRPIGDDAFIFNGFNKNAEMKEMKKMPKENDKKFKQNNPVQIATDMNLYGDGKNGQQMGWEKPWPNWTGKLEQTSKEVQCAIAVSRVEDSLMGDALFGDDTGVLDDLKQDAFCNCDKTFTPNPQYADELKQYNSYCQN